MLKKIFREQQGVFAGKGQSLRHERTGSAFMIAFGTGNILVAGHKVKNLTKAKSGPSSQRHVRTGPQTKSLPLMNTDKKHRFTRMKIQCSYRCSSVVRFAPCWLRVDAPRRCSA